MTIITSHFTVVVRVHDDSISSIGPLNVISAGLIFRWDMIDGGSMRQIDIFKISVISI
jgi:hypothetical protein